MITTTRDAQRTVGSTSRRRAWSTRTTIALVVVAAAVVASSAAAYAPHAPGRPRRRSVASRDSSIPSRTITTALSSSSSDNGDEGSRHRLAVIGASVSPRGFVALLSHGPSGVVLPVPVSSSRRSDAEAATSSEALTFLQLLGGVDVGAEGVLPVGASVRLAAARCRSSSTDDDPAVEAFRSAPTRTDDWGRVRTLWPDVRVDRVELRMDARRADDDDDDGPPATRASFTLACTVAGRHPLSVPLDGPSSYDDDDEVSSSLPTRDPDDDVDDDVARRALAAFRALALALRYRAPVESVVDPTTIADPSTACVLDPNDDDDVGGLPSLADAYPVWRSADSLELQSTRVAETVRKGFEANRLEGALRVAVRVGDRAAEERIRRRIAEYDRLDDLPVLGETDDDDDDDRQRSSPDDAVLGEGEDGTWG